MLKIVAVDKMFLFARSYLEFKSFKMYVDFQSQL